MTADSAPTSTQQLRTTKATHPHLPPGLILDENGKVCKVCNSWQDFAKIKKKNPGSQSSSGNGSGSASAKGMAGFAAMMGGAASSASASAPPAPAPATPVKLEPAAVDRTNCPPDTAELGRSTWTFLHTTAAYYPLSAPPKQQENMTRLLSSLSLLYPCNWCATDFQKDMRAHPPDVSGREGLMRWLCERHNEVNRKLGKDEFGCDTPNLDRRWKDGPEDGSCD